MRKSSIFFLSLTMKIVLLGLLLVHAALTRGAHSTGLRQKSEMVRMFELTDLCLFTEARYTRHLSQADLNTAFQDYPLSFEHFPSGSFVLPPETIKKIYERVD